MGFLDQAKKVAEQAQAKLDEAQKQFHAARGGGAPAAGPAVDDDEHGRPVPQAAPDSASPPQGDPLAGATPAARPAGPVPDPQAPPSEDRDAGPGVPEDRDDPGSAPPKPTSGEPLQS
jgi:hypothetical protein